MTPDQLEDLKGNMAGIRCNFPIMPAIKNGKGYPHAGRLEHPCANTVGYPDRVCTCCTDCMAPCVFAAQVKRNSK